MAAARGKQHRSTGSLRRRCGRRGQTLSLAAPYLERNQVFPARVRPLELTTVGVNRNDFVAPVTLSGAKKSAQTGSAAMYHCRVCTLIAL
jgi:hypothetical protein